MLITVILHIILFLYIHLIIYKFNVLVKIKHYFYIFLRIIHFKIKYKTAFDFWMSYLYVAGLILSTNVIFVVNLMSPICIGSLTTRDENINGCLNIEQQPTMHK